VCLCFSEAAALSIGQILMLPFFTCCTFELLFLPSMNDHRHCHDLIHGIIIIVQQELYARISELEKTERERHQSELNSVTNRVFTQFRKRTSAISDNHAISSDDK